MIFRSLLCDKKFVAVLTPDLTESLDVDDMAEACVFNDRAETFLLGILASPCDKGGPLDLLVKTLRPFRLPLDVCSERVSAGWLALDIGLSFATVMKP